MKPSRVLLVLLLFVAFLLPGQADAFWWLFGKSEAEVETRYLYLNNVAFSETGSKVTFYKDMLPNGTITVKGQAAAGRNKVGSVRITTDGKDTWVDVRVSDNGTFEYAFRPDMNKVYRVYLEITDTTGKTNKIDDTFKEITISALNIQAVVRDILDKLFAAYQAKNPAQFMALIAEDFAGDKTSLDRAVRKDFSAFDIISLRYILNNVVSDATGKIFASISFNRTATSTRGMMQCADGRQSSTCSDKGSTGFTFKLGDRMLSLWGMRIPLIFGVSDLNVANGPPMPQEDPNQKLLSVNNQGQPSYKTEKQLVDEQGGGGGGETSPPKNLMATCTGGGPLPPVCNFQGLIFADGSVVTNPAPGNPDLMVMVQPFPGATPNIFLKGGATHKNLGVVHIENVTSVPTSGYGGGPEIWDVINNVGHTFALKLPDGRYAAFEIYSVTNLSAGGTVSYRVTIKYKYQPTVGVNTF
jgi:hypothetical protein